MGAKFEPMLLDVVSKVSPCFAYRGKKEGESDGSYVQRLALELDLEFQRVGTESVCAFVAEPVVGAALGCVPAVPGYFQAIHNVCRKYGALLILDEVMSGMGRTGTYHAWQQEGVVPDIQTVGKGLGGGYQPVAGLLINKRIVDALDKGSGSTKSPFPAKDKVATQISELALTDRYSMMIYPGAGTADGVNGDHIILAPPYTVTAEDVEYIVATVSRIVVDYFSQHVPNGNVN
ncbi:hypothetical protein SLS53_000827 [Cytospora paraplurivora]|uniref:Aminotransferase n=1 Tax=Cytospora paraplurivora TaxID=2898453 RepID=A0AAN9YKQ9_9PEZI